MQRERGPRPAAEARGPRTARPAGPGGRASAGGAVAVLLGAAAWGSTGTAAHFVPAGASPASIGAARIVLGGAVLLAMALGGQRPQLRALLAAGWTARLSLLVAAVAVSGYQLCFFSAVRLTGVAVGTVLAIGSAPVFTGIVSRLTGGTPLTGRWLIATVAAIAGCAILVTGGRAAGAQLGGAGLALLAGFCYSVYAVTAARLISGGAPETTVMGVLFGTAGLLLAPVLAATSTAWLLTGRGLAVLAYLSLVTTVAAYLLYGRGLRTVPAPVAVTLGLAEPVVAALLGVVVLGERLTGPAVAGLVLVGLAIAVLTAGRTPADERVNTGLPG